MTKKLSNADQSWANVQGMLDTLGWTFAVELMDGSIENHKIQATERHTALAILRRQLGQDFRVVAAHRLDRTKYKSPFILG